MKYDFSDLQIIQTHGNTWGFRDLAAAPVRELSVDLSIFFTGGVSSDSVYSSIISIPEDEGTPSLSIF